MFQRFLLVLSLHFWVCNERPSTLTNTHQAESTRSEHIVIGDTLDFDSKIAELKSSLTDDFIIQNNSYFVIASNLSKNETEKIINNTIERAVECFYNDYFVARPGEVTTIFLFKDDATYRFWAKKLYGDTDLSRFGYYKPYSKVMLMNISTGTGTLVHELTHALVRYDFPDIPSWFNEGLGSLYERCSLNNGIILGYVNWRLPDLQESIRKGSYTGLDKLVATNEDEFYGSGSSFNYSQARYLCMYMQEKGLLKRFYKTFRDNYAEDKTGKMFLEKIFNQKIEETDEAFLKWVNTLEYRD